MRRTPNTYLAGINPVSPMNDLRITLVQTEISWCDPAENRRRLTDRLAELVGTTDLVVLPEMFTTGFTMEPGPVAEPMGGPSMRWMQARAAALGAVVTGSLVIEEGGFYYNRLIWMRSDGTHAAYDKRHLFAMAGEGDRYVAGRERLIVDYKGWRICPLVCYDLRFPVWARNTDAYDLLIYTANWPSKRRAQWRTLLNARAIENQAYVVGVNRVGTDNNGYHYSGDSLVASPGEAGELYHVEQSESVDTVLLPGADLVEIRTRLPFLTDRDTFTLPEVPGF